MSTRFWGRQRQDRVPLADARVGRAVTVAQGWLLAAGSDHVSLPEEQLDCHSSIIKEIREAEVVTPFMLMTAQVFVCGTGWGTSRQTAW